jgi:hypothetical protein
MTPLPIFDPIAVGDEVAGLSKMIAVDSIADRLNAGHDRLAQIAADPVYAALLPAAHLGVPLLEEVRLDPNDICIRHHQPSTVLVTFSAQSYPQSHVAVRTVQSEPALKFGDMGSQRRNQRNEFFSRWLCLRFGIHRILESKSDSVVEKIPHGCLREKMQPNLASYQK